MHIIVIIGVFTANMGREHKHAPICGKSTPLCRFMELYAEGHIKDEQDGHNLISQLFERLDGFSYVEIKKYNLNSRKRQLNLGLCYGINYDVPPTDYEEYLLKLKKLYEKREEMKKKKVMEEIVRMLKEKLMILDMIQKKRNSVCQNVLWKENQ